MKYILEIKPEYEANGIMILGARDSHLYVTTLEVKDLEELNSDYISKHFSDLQDDAYQRGLDDAWEAARKVALNSNDGGLSIEKLDEIFDRYTLQQVLKEYTAKQTIEKLKAYEEKQKADEIKVGDEVRHDGGHIFVVTAVDNISVYGIDGTGNFKHSLKCYVHRTGRHFDILSILKEMRK